MVGDGYRPTLPTGVTAAGVRHPSAAVRARGSLQMPLLRSYYSAREANLGLWLAAYLTTSVRSRYRPVLTGAGIAAHMPWIVLSPGERGA